MTETELVEENRKLRKINRVLMDRVERSTDAQGNAFSLFQSAIVLEKLVQQRTGELRAANAARGRGGNYLATASHDLLEPLNVARLFLDALTGSPLDGESARMVERVSDALESAESLLNAVLDMARFDAGTMRPEIRDVSIDRLLQRLGHVYGRSADERGLRLRIAPSDAVVRTDPALLERVLRNLVSNALRYTERGGVLVGCRRRGDRLRIEVWDTGIGIPAGAFESIFEEFAQIDEGGGRRGSGLGLAIVRRIADLLEHRITVRSRVFRGSVFGIDVPIGDPSRAPAMWSADAVTGGDPLRDRCILVVENDLRALDGMTALLRSWGCRALGAPSIDAAVASVRDLETAPDAIVADYHLGTGTTGIDAIARVCAERRAAIPAVVVTADRGDDTRAAVIERGHRLLTKPVRVDRLRSLLRHLVGGAAPR